MLSLFSFRVLLLLLLSSLLFPNLAPLFRLNLTLPLLFGSRAFGGGKEGEDAVTDAVAVTATVTLR